MYEAQAHGAERSRLQLAYEAHDLGQTTYETHHMGYLREIGRRVSILVSGEIAKCCDPVARQELRNMCSIVFMFIWWIVPMLFANRGDEDTENVSDNTHKMQFTNAIASGNAHPRR